MATIFFGHRPNRPENPNPLHPQLAFFFRYFDAMPLLLVWLNSE
jgi:hypothetical protein